MAIIAEEGDGTRTTFMALARSLSLRRFLFRSMVNAISLGRDGCASTGELSRGAQTIILT